MTDQQDLAKLKFKRICSWFSGIGVVLMFLTLGLTRQGLIPYAFEQLFFALAFLVAGILAFFSPVPTGTDLIAHDKRKTRYFLGIGFIIAAVIEMLWSFMLWPT
jgi:hypothetical protein